MKRLPVILLVVALSAVLAGCGASGASVGQKAVLAWADPIVDNMMAAWNQGDYAKFSADFDATMQAKETQALFLQQRQQVTY